MVEVTQELLPLTFHAKDDVNAKGGIQQDTLIVNSHKIKMPKGWARLQLDTTNRVYTDTEREHWYFLPPQEI